MADTEIKERVVGQLLVMQSFIESLPSDESVFRFLCKGLKNVPGIGATGICVQKLLISTDSEMPFDLAIVDCISTDTGTYSGKPDPSLLVVPIRTADITFASLLLRIPDQTKFTPYHPLIANLCNSVGFLLNDRRVKKMLENHERLLTQAVEQRTHSLKLEIEERTRVELSLRKLTEAVEQSPVAVIICDRQGNIEYASPAVSASTGRAPHEVLRLNLRSLLNDKLQQEKAEIAWQQVSTGANWNGISQCYRENGSAYWEEIVLAPVRSIDKSITSFVALMHDITAQHEAEQRADFLTHYDALTMLPNRILSKDRMQQAIARADRDMSRVAVIFLDIDHFKKINDSLGHNAGNRLLQAVADRLRECIGETDTLCREGGDEFLIILPDLSDIEKCTAVITKIQNQMNLPFRVDGEELYVTTSMGIALYPDDGNDFDSVFKSADTAMYRAKEAGRNTYRFFMSQMNSEANRYLRLRNDLNRAILRNEFVLYYQPQISLRSGKIIGVEALIRWHHPDLGLLSPGSFIQVAEESGLILPIGSWVLHEACRQGVEWQRGGLENLGVAINLSPIQLSQSNLLQNISSVLAETGMPQDLLEVEFTESALI